MVYSTGESLNKLYKFRPFPKLLDQEMDVQKISRYDGILFAAEESKNMDFLERNLKEYGICEEFVEEIKKYASFYLAVLVGKKDKIFPQNASYAVGCGGNFIAYPIYPITPLNKRYVPFFREVLKKFQDGKEHSENELISELTFKYREISIPPRRLRKFLEKLCKAGVFESKPVFLREEEIVKVEDTKYKCKPTFKLLFY